MSVTHIFEYHQQDTIAALQEMLQRAKDGKLRGVVFSAKTGPKRHRIGFTGDYCRDPAEALICAARMEYKANQLISANDDDPETTSMPL